MSLNVIKLASVAAALAALSFGAQAQSVVDFEDVAGYAFLANSSIVSDGFSVAHTGSFAQVLDAGQTAFSGDGTTRLISFNTSTITLSTVGGASFGATGFDGGESWILSGSPHYWATQILVVGALATGGTTSQTFDLDLIKDPITGMQHFALNSSFQNLNSLSFSGIGGNPEFSIDNVATTAPVPEPETYALMLAGLGALGFVARRRQRA
ncbi:MAG: PEP-CTERM sorting domain-containing protein [Burkholderiales bacterium]